MTGIKKVSNDIHKYEVNRKVVYRPHLKRRLKERKFPNNYPRLVYKNTKIKFFDTLTNHYITISKLKYAGKLRNIMISYDRMGNRIDIITIHPISDKDINTRIKSGRWQKK